MSQSGAPQFRANWTKLTLKFLRDRAAPDRDPILTRVSGEVLAQVRAAGVFEWLPASLHLAIANAVHGALGQYGSRRFWRDLMVLSFDRSLLKPLVDGGIRLFGRSPLGILRMTPQAYSLISRDCGVVRVDPGPGPGSVRLTFDALPPQLRVPAWVEVCAGNCEAALAALDLRGTVTTDASALDDGRFVVVTVPLS
jgi:hypothetical protein